MIDGPWKRRPSILASSLGALEATSVVLVAAAGGAASRLPPRQSAEGETDQQSNSGVELLLEGMLAMLVGAASRSVPGEADELGVAG